MVITVQLCASPDKLGVTQCNKLFKYNKKAEITTQQKKKKKNCFV